MHFCVTGFCLLLNSREDYPELAEGSHTCTFGNFPPLIFSIHAAAGTPVLSFISLIFEP